MKHLMSFVLIILSANAYSQEDTPYRFVINKYCEHSRVDNTLRCYPDKILCRSLLTLREKPGISYPETVPIEIANVLAPVAYCQGKWDRFILATTWEYIEKDPKSPFRYAVVTPPPTLYMLDKAAMRLILDAASEIRRIVMTPMYEDAFIYQTYRP
jgi:hypothetical protein